MYGTNVIHSSKTYEANYIFISKSVQRIHPSLQLFSKDKYSTIFAILHFEQIAIVAMMTKKVMQAKNVLGGEHIFKWKS